VGLGVVGIKTLIISFLRDSLTSPFADPVTKPIAQIPLRGYSTKTA
jgi:hypothetical protein